MRDCDEHQNENWESEKPHCHRFQTIIWGEKKGENGGKVEVKEAILLLLL